MALRGARSAGLNFLQLLEPEQMAIDAGVNLYELRKVALSHNGVKDFGLWDIKASLRMVQNSSINQSHVVTWVDGPSAYITYRANDKGVCTGFCPDDPLWHNRLILCAISTKNTVVDRYHTRDGVVAGALAKQELDILFNAIHDYKLVDNDDPVDGVKTLFRSANPQEVEAAYRDYVIKNRSEKSKYQVLVSKIEEIEALIFEYSSDWFKSETFQKEIRPSIEAEIKAFTDESTVGAVAGDVLANVRKMTPEQRTELAALLNLAPAPVQLPVTIGTNVDTQEQSTETPTEAMKLDDLRRIAADQGIVTGRKSKAQLLEEIRAQSVASALQNSPGPKPMTELTNDEAEEEVFN
jgi:hypothetical protein